MLPRTIGVAGSQINLIVMTSIASTLSEGSISIFNLAQNLQNLPIGIIGVSFAVAVFAPMSKSLADGARSEFLKEFSSTFRQVSYIIFPLSFLMFVLRDQIVEIILRHGKFSQASADLTAASLGLFCLGVWAIAFIPLLSRAFFAFKDTRTPAIVVFLTVTLNIILSLYFIRLFSGDASVLGLPLAFALSGILQFVLLMFFLYKKIGNFNLREIWSSVSKVILASFIMAATAYYSSYFIPSAYLKVIVGVSVSLGVYFFATHLLRSPEAKAVKSRIVPRLIRNKTAWRE